MKKGERETDDIYKKDAESNGTPTNQNSVFFFGLFNKKKNNMLCCYNGVRSQFLHFFVVIF